MAAGRSKICIWVRPDPFLLGILPVASHPKLAIKFLRRIIPYAQNKGQLGYPKLSYSVWKHIACHKLQLPEAIAWMYFTVYRTLHRPKSESKLQWDCHYAKRTDFHERDHLKSLTTVDTLKFVLLLYLQLYNKITLRATSVASLSSEEWPSFERTTEHVNRSTSRRVMKILDEQHHVSFVGRRLVEILELLGEHTSQRFESDKERLLPLEVIEALSFIVEGTLDNMKTVLPLHGEPGVLDNVNGKNWSMISNAKSGLKSHRYLIITRCNKQTIAKCSESMCGISARVHRCHSSYIYLLVPLNDCQSSVFHLLSPTHPVLIGNRNENLTLAPFHTTYPKLEAHMAEAGIGHLLNLWDSPLCLSDDGNLVTQNSWTLLPPEDFYIFNIPIEMEGTTKKIPGVPIPQYQNAMREKKQQMDAWHHLVKSSNLTRSQREQLNKLVRARFQAWLVISGHQRELDGLFSPSGSHAPSQSTK